MKAEPANIGGYAETIKRLSITFFDLARSELAEIQAVTRKALQLVLNREGNPTE